MSSAEDFYKKKENFYHYTEWLLVRDMGCWAAETWGEGGRDTRCWAAETWGAGQQRHGVLGSRDVGCWAAETQGEGGRDTEVLEGET